MTVEERKEHFALTCLKLFVTPTLTLLTCTKNISVALGSDEPSVPETKLTYMFSMALISGELIILSPFDAWMSSTTG